ncbi:stress response protein [Halobacteriales archaeon QS_1_68_20]|nr:MAG: stress response protein [Halobacteriales archaeon QS_1_68_20]
MYGRILVPTDGSPEVERAVDHAVDLAAAHGATVHAVYVVNTASYTTLPMESAWEGVGEMLREDGEAALQRVREKAATAGVDAETRLVEGSPSREIVRYAENENCDLVVMGTHGRGGIDRLLLGSVAERVVRSSKVPVLTVRVGDAGLEAERETPEAAQE